MPEHPSAADLARLPATEINDLIRQMTAGRRDWSREELRALAVLQAAWREADARESALAA